MKLLIHCFLTLLMMGGIAMGKPYEGKLILKENPRSITVTADANSPSEAMKIIEAQYGKSNIKRWTHRPRPVKN